MNNLDSSYLFNTSSSSSADFFVLINPKIPTFNHLSRFITGEWSSGDSRWNFAMDKEIMLQIILIFPDMSLLELQNNVVNEFFTVTDAAPLLVLSYWPPNTKELVTEISTPPVMFIHHGFVKTTLHELNQDNITWTKLVMMIVYIWIPCLVTLIVCIYGYHVHMDIVFRYTHGYYSQVYTWVLFSQKSNPFIQHKLHLVILHTTIYLT